MSRPKVIPLDQVSTESSFSMVDRYSAIGSNHKALVLDHPGGVRMVVLVCGAQITEEIIETYLIGAEMRCKRFVAAGIGCKGDHTCSFTGFLAS